MRRRGAIKLKNKAESISVMSRVAVTEVSAKPMSDISEPEVPPFQRIAQKHKIWYPLWHIFRSCLKEVNAVGLLCGQKRSD
jgi:hypothetical protein